MAGLARNILVSYQERDRHKYLENLFRLKLAADDDTGASDALSDLRRIDSLSPSPQVRANTIPYEILARAKAAQTATSDTFGAVLPRAFRDVVGPLDNRTSALAIRALTLINPADLRRSLDDDLAQPGALSLRDALKLIRDYEAAVTLAEVIPVVKASIAEDDQRRYVIESDILVPTPDGASICAMVVRPRSGPARLPALLNFTIYADPVTLMAEARRTASNDYAGVEGLTRGKGCSPDAAVPYEHDGADADALIEWISRRAWSDGRVGMYGGSYEGFTQWAAAKHRPKALQALMPSVTAAPGIDVPMEGNVFQSFPYYWPFYTTNNKTVDNAALNDHARWNRLNRMRYLSGRSYRSLDKIDGTPNPIFDRWLTHPSYDAYWQGMIPYGAEFSGLDIPVLTTDGYYDTAQIGGLYYVLQGEKYTPRAEHYLVIGPYDHIRGQRGTFGALGDPREVLNGYKTDPAAQIDIGELRYQWFDYVFKGAPKPALLRDRINYEVMGANLWKHAPSIEAMSSHKRRFHLAPSGGGPAYRLTEDAGSAGAFVAQTVDLADRSDVDRLVPGGGIVDKAIDTWNGIEFLSVPFEEPVEISGLFSGLLELEANKIGLDFQIQLYELTPNSEYVFLSHYMTRASYAADRSRSVPLVPGKRARLAFNSGIVTSRLLQKGSRLVAVISIVKEPDAQINYGAGGDVSDEDVLDAKEPLRVKWYGESFLDIPFEPIELIN